RPGVSHPASGTAHRSARPFQPRSPFRGTPRWSIPRAARLDVHLLLVVEASAGLRLRTVASLRPRSGQYLVPILTLPASLRYLVLAAQDITARWNRPSSP